MFPYAFGFFIGMFLVGMVGEIAIMARAFRQFREQDDPACFPQALFWFAPCVLCGAIGAVAVVILRAFGYLT